MAKNPKRGHFEIFQHPFCHQTSKNRSRRPVKKQFGDPLVSPGTGIVCYAEKQEKHFWLSSLGQMVQFDTIKVCRTFVEMFWPVRED